MHERRPGQGPGQNGVDAATLDVSIDGRGAHPDGHGHAVVANDGEAEIFGHSLEGSQAHGKGVDIGWEHQQDDSQEKGYQVDLASNLAQEVELGELEHRTHAATSAMT